MNLVIFDIDGTLTRTNAADQHCYIRTIEAVISPDLVAFDEESFTHFTDSFIIAELFRRHKGEATPDDVQRFKAAYLQTLQHTQAHNPDGFQAVAGAQDVFHQLPDTWATALATGCWEESALLKLKFANIDTRQAPLATASEAQERANIVRSAIAKAEKHYQSTFERIVYIGDGIWDLRTCAELGLPFVGIDAEQNTRKRALLGNFFQMEHYQDISNFVQLLEQAAVPTC